MIFSNEDKIIVQNYYEEKNCRLWLEAAYDCFSRRKHGFDRTVGLLTGRAAPYAFSTKKNCRTNKNQSIRRMMKKETLNSSSAWKHQKWVKRLETEEKPALVPLEKDLKLISVWSKKRSRKMKRFHYWSSCQSAERSFIW